jgi:hypothetical protein
MKGGKAERLNTEASRQPVALLPAGIVKNKKVCCHRLMSAQFVDIDWDTPLLFPAAASFAGQPETAIMRPILPQIPRRFLKLRWP